MVSPELLEDKLNQFLASHETFQLAFIEAIHRYYYDECFTKQGKGSRFKGDEESEYISALYDNLYKANPDWRYKFKKQLQRYDGWEGTRMLPIDAKPKRKVESPAISIKLKELT